MTGSKGETMKKVGILTLFTENFNYGALFQAYALQETVLSMGFDCEIIDFEYFPRPYVMNLPAGVQACRRKSQDYLKKLNVSKQRYTAQTIHESNEEYDIFITGSDQVWFYSGTVPYLSSFALDFVEEGKPKIAYAASFGRSIVTEQYKKALERGISRLDAISVREQSAIPFLSGMTEKKVCDVLDPVFFLSQERWTSISEKPNEPEPYIFLYAVIENQEMEDAVKKIQDKMNCKLVRSAYQEENPISPQDFLGLISGASYVITNSFHGSILSIIHQKQFVATENDKLQSAYSVNTRMIDLLEKFGLQDRFVRNGTDLVERALGEPIDFKPVQEKLASLQEISWQFLKNALSMEKKQEFDIVPRKDCYGCSACKVACPHDCITMEPQNLGFLFPKIDHEQCTNCGICSAVCPSLATLPAQRNNPIMYAAKHMDDRERRKSTSGGVFYGFAETVIGAGGVVFGASYDENWAVHHSWTDSLDGLEQFRGSKYVQSNVKNTYMEAQTFLDEGRHVLYSGTPCQIAALRSFLGKSYPNLYTVDLFCHGVPGPDLLKKYVSFVEDQHGPIETMEMRSKAVETSGGMRIKFQSGEEKIELRENDPFLSVWFHFCRDRCYHCQYKGEKIQGDLTIGDFWGSEYYIPEKDDRQGLSLVTIGTQQGEYLLRQSKSISCIQEIDSYDWQRYNPSIQESVKKEPQETYLRSIFQKSSIEKIFYENKLYELKQGNEIVRMLSVQKQLDSLLKLKLDGILPVDFHGDEEKIVIYGAGIVGKRLYDYVEGRVICFIDAFQSGKTYGNAPVFHKNHVELKKLLKNSATPTVVVTPCWDFENVKNNLIEVLPLGARICALDHLFEHWV